MFGECLDSPRPDKLVRIAQQLLSKIEGKGPRRYQCPDRAKSVVVTIASASCVLQLCDDIARKWLRSVSRCQFEPSGTRMPVVGMLLGGYQFPIAGPTIIHMRRFVVRVVLHPIDTTIPSIPLLDVRIMTQTGIVPIGHVDRAIGSQHEIDANELRVGTKQKIFSRVDAVVATRLTAIDLVVELMAMKVMGQQMVAVFGGPIVPQIDHGAHMRVTTINVPCTRFASPTLSGIVASGGEQEVL